MSENFKSQLCCAHVFVIKHLPRFSSFFLNLNLMFSVSVRVVTTLGVKTSLEVYYETESIEENGGMDTLVCCYKIFVVLLLIYIYPY